MIDDSEGVLDEYGAVKRKPVFGPAAEPGPDVMNHPDISEGGAAPRGRSMGGNPIMRNMFGPPPATPNATVDQSLGQPRGAIDKAYQDPSYRTSQAGIPMADGISFKVPGPISGAANAVPTGPVQRPDTFNNQARLDAYAARDAQAQQLGYQQNNLGNQRAQASYDASTAQRNADVSRFVAQNGADVVLAPENSGYDGQRKAIFDTAARDAATAATASGRVGTIDTAIAGSGQPYIAQNATSQEELNRAQLASKAGAASDVDLAHKELSLEQQKQLYGLQQQLANTTDPEKQKILQNKIAAFSAKRTEGTKFSPVDIDTGHFKVDFQGNKEPIFKKGVFNHDTGEIVGDTKQAADPVAAVKGLSADNALAMAKAAIAAGRSRDDVNKMLKAAGHKEI